jgi:putative RNA 2'-phosphotransferase
MTDRQVRLSKTVSHALRHEPASYGLVPDENGWVEVEALLAALAKSGWPGLGEDDLHEMTARSPKKRHEIVAGRIRARHGHSIAVQLGVPASRPPDLLHHGTQAATVPLILEQGLRPMRRRQVHLSTTQSQAVEVARRHGPDPVVLVVRAGAAHAAGVAFHDVGNAVWLADAVPPAFVEAPEGQGRAVRSG